LGYVDKHFVYIVVVSPW